MIEKLELEKFKCFDLQEFRFCNVNFLSGINSVGKSSVIQGILAAIQSVNHTHLELNGSLVNLGEFSDALKSDATDSGIRICMQIDELYNTWKFDSSGEGDGVENTSALLACIPKTDDAGQEKLTELKENFQYLSAERWGPRDNVPFVRNHRINWLGKYGENTLQFLYYLFDEETKKYKYTLNEESKRLLKSDSNRYALHVIGEWVEMISPGSLFDVKGHRSAGTGWITFKSSGNSAEYKATNVGFGLSYVLSIVTALVCAKKGDVILLENPEAHMHPKGQSLLGQLIARTGEDGVQVIVETHSEHLINGARVSIKEKLLAPENMKVFFFDKKIGSTSAEVTEIFAKENADLSEWPEGFFDQTSIDLLRILQGNK